MTFIVMVTFKTFAGFGFKGTGFNPVHPLILKS